MKRVAAILVSLVALGMCSAAAAAAAADGSYGPWEPTFQGAIAAPAGAVCPFEVTAAPVFEKLRIRYRYDESGNVVGYQVTGPLVAQITNTETGATVRRNLSGLGTVTLNPDGSYDAVGEGNFLIFFGGGDNPASELLLAAGRTVLHGAPTGEKTLVSVTGRTENLCRTLA